jgi:hypothetical protein
LDGNVERPEIDAVGLPGGNRQGRSDGKLKALFCGIVRFGLPSTVHAETLTVWVPPTRVRVIEFCGIRIWTFDVFDPVVVKTPLAPPARHG